MLKIGITGGIGSGKTIVCKLFELQNVPVFYADLEARIAMNTDRNLIAQLKTTFGKHIYSDDGSLNRSKLASLVFNNEIELKKLNSLVHPAVYQRFDVWVQQQNASYVIKEAALLFESNSYKNCDVTILVKSTNGLKISRVMKRDSLTRDEIIQRMEKQLSDAEKELLADHIIQNDEHRLIIPQVLNLHQLFLNLPKPQ